MNYIIIGSGVAGVSAAKEIVKDFAKKKDNIILLSQENEPFYYRPRLIQCLSGEIGVKDIIINDRDWFIKNCIDLKLGEKVKKISLAEKKVISERDEYAYDKLLLANGASPFVPPIEGIDMENIFTLRDARDAELIHSQAQKSEKAIVVGGGLLGLESAINLEKVDLKVDVIEMGEYLLQRQLDSTGGELLKNKLEKMGCQFYLDSITESFLGDKKVEAVKLKDGTIIETDMVLLSTGIRSNLDLVEDTDIEVDKGIIVNNHMETSVADVYAAGDVAEYDGRVYGIWPPSMEQGKIAGKNMVNKSAEFTGFVPSHTLKVAGVDVTSLGILEEKDSITSEVIAREENYCRIFKNDKEAPVGAIIVGDYSEKDEIIKEIKKG